MTEGVLAEVDLSAVRFNFEQIRAIIGNRRIIAMIKSNGYGHGAVRIAQALPQADAFGVAAVEEAIILRESQIKQPIVVMSRLYNETELKEISARNLDVVIHHQYQMELLERIKLTKPINVWLKIDSGMHRLGINLNYVQQAWKRLNAINWVKKPIYFMTHLACADQLENFETEQQIAVFMQAVQNLPGPKSIANSAAIIAYPNSLVDWVRPGILLYGVSPFADRTGSELGFKPVMTLSSRLIAVNQLSRGDKIGYGATYQCPEDMLVGVAEIGYGDGYPRHAQNGTPVLVNGVICPLIGRVSMDMITIDLRAAPHSKIGDPVILWGPGLPIEKIALSAQTISYELFCQMTERVKFVSVN